MRAMGRTDLLEDAETTYRQEQKKTVHIFFRSYGTSTRHIPTRERSVLGSGVRSGWYEHPFYRRPCERETGERFFQLDRPTSAADDEELKMKLRPRYHGHQNAILCHSACSPSGMFLQVSKRDTDSYLRSKYPDVENILYLSPSFSTVVSYLKVDFSSSTFGRTFYHLLLNREITTYFSNLTNTRFDRLGTNNSLGRIFLL
jgi:hypothetical protein